MEPTHSRPHRNLVGHLALVARGFCMGAADIVPGVSGGTMAFILGIYEELIHSIKAFDRRTIRLLLHFKIRTALRYLPWQFLLSLGTGVVLAILSLAHFLETQLQAQPSRIWSFFFGLVLASVVTVSRSVQRWNATALVSALVAVGAGYLLVGVVPVQTPETYWYLFLSGALAICAMILPGISGAFILVLLGKYEYVLSAVNNRDILTLAAVMAGAILGIMTFARILSWLFDRHNNTTVATLTGLMIGSLRKLWPWKETLSTNIDRHGNVVPLEQINVFPATFDADVRFAVGMAILGLAVVLIITWLGERKTRDVT